MSDTKPIHSPLKLQVILHVVVFVWGFTGILGKLISVRENVLVWWRMLIAMLALAIFMGVSRRGFRLSKRNLLMVLGTGLIICLHWIFFYGAIKISNVSVAVSCMAVASFFTAFLQPLFFKTKMVWYEFILGIGVILGVSVLMGVETDKWEGFVWGLISAFFAALFTVINAGFVKRMDSTVISFYEMTGGFLGLTVYNFFIGALTTDSLALNTSDTWYLLLLGIACTALPFVISVWVMKQLSPYTVSISVNMEPIYTILLAILIWPEKETMSAGFYIGSGIILLTVVLNGYLKSRTSKS
ncbi:MAG: DMT family transporter [Flavobacteriales bacterium]